MSAEPNPMPENLNEETVHHGPRPCANHPHTETRLACSYCDTPICTKCMVVCEVGIKCKKCTGKMKSHILQVSWKELAIAGGASLVSGMLFGNIYPFMAFGMFILQYILCFLIGQGCGHLVHRLVKYKLGVNLSVAMFIGAAIGLALSPFQETLMLMVDYATTGQGELYMDDLIKITLFMLGMLQIFNFRR